MFAVALLFVEVSWRSYARGWPKHPCQIENQEIYRRRYCLSLLMLLEERKGERVVLSPLVRKVAEPELLRPQQLLPAEWELVVEAQLGLVK